MSPDGVYGPMVLMCLQVYCKKKWGGDSEKTSRFYFLPIGNRFQFLYCMDFSFTTPIVYSSAHVTYVSYDKRRVYNLFVPLLTRKPLIQQQP